MKLHRLEIGGFGRLSDLDVDFHPRMTVLLGENESGKSTVQRALRAALNFRCKPPSISSTPSPRC